jgi:hypothetical protein
VDLLPLVKHLGLHKKERRMQQDHKYKIGDMVIILHSDHDDYFFDDPVGNIIAINPPDEDGVETFTVLIEVEVPSNRIC